MYERRTQLGRLSFEKFSMKEAENCSKFRRQGDSKKKAHWGWVVTWSKDDCHTIGRPILCKLISFPTLKEYHEMKPSRHCHSPPTTVTKPKPLLLCYAIHGGKRFVPPPECSSYSSKTGRICWFTGFAWCKKRVRVTMGRRKSCQVKVPQHRVPLCANFGSGRVHAVCGLPGVMFRT